MAAIETKEKMDKKAVIVTVAVVLAMIVDGLDLQVLALAFPMFMKEMNMSPLILWSVWGSEESAPAGLPTGLDGFGSPGGLSYCFQYVLELSDFLRNTGKLPSCVSCPG